MRICRDCPNPVYNSVCLFCNGCIQETSRISKAICTVVVGLLQPPRYYFLAQAMTEDDEVELRKSLLKAVPEGWAVAVWSNEDNTVDIAIRKLDDRMFYSRVIRVQVDDVQVPIDQASVLAGRPRNKKKKGEQLKLF